MLKKVIAVSLRHPGMVLSIALLFMGFVMYQLPKIPVDVFPELNAPTVVVMSEAQGLDSLDVEQYVTFPIESAVNGLPGVRRIRSTSALSLSIVYVEFGWGQDIYRARQLVSEKLSGIRADLPDSVHTEIAPIASITGEIMLVSLSSPDNKVSPMELRKFAEFDLRNRLLGVSGVTQVVAIGGELPEYQININQEQIRKYGISTQEVIDAAAKSHSIASAGYLPNVNGQELPIMQNSRVTSVDSIKDTIVRYHDGVPLTLGQIADIKMGPAPQRGSASENGTPAVVLSIQKSPGTNTLSLTDDINDALVQIEKSLPEGMVLNKHVMRQSDFIMLSINNVVAVSRDAAILVCLVLILFLLNVRTTIITLTALPLSLAASIFIMWLFGLTLNVMTLGGLAVAIGELVDDAIIDVENVLKRLKENAHLPIEEQKNRWQVIYDASNEIRSSVVFATIIICIVFLPLLFLQGLEGRFFRPLGLAYITSILSSLIVALTVTPAMCYFLLKGKILSDAHGETDSRFVRFLKRNYIKSLKFCLNHKKLIFGLSGVSVLLCIGLASTFGTSFLPRFNEGTFTVMFMAPRGTSLEESTRMAIGVEKELAKIDGVRAVVRRTGRAERDEHAEPVSNSEIDVSVKPGHSREQIREKIDAVLANVPGISKSVGQPIEHRLSHVLSGAPADIAINIFGEDLSKLRKIVKEIEPILKAIPGTRDVTANRELLNDSISIDYKIPELKRFGISPADAAQQVQIAFSGYEVAVVNDGIYRYGMTVRFDESSRKNLEDIKNLLLHNNQGQQVELSQVADVAVTRTPNSIARENASRKAMITLNVADGYNLGDLVTAVQEKIDPIVHKSGLLVSYGGQFEAQKSAGKTILIMGAGVIVIIYLLLSSAFGSGKAAALVMVNLPLSLIGGIISIYITTDVSPIMNTLALIGIHGHYEAPIISIATMVGFITLFGIAVRNGILLVNHYKQLKDSISDTKEIVIQGSNERLVPILMTALTAILGLIPIAYAAGEPGSELLAPLAIVVLGGLITSTILNLYIVPLGYSILFKNNKITQKERIHENVS